MDPEPNFYGIAITLPTELAVKVVEVQETFKRLQEALWLFYEDPSNIEGNMEKAEAILEELVQSGKQGVNTSEAASNAKASRR